MIDERYRMKRYHSFYRLSKPGSHFFKAMQQVWRHFIDIRDPMIFVELSILDRDNRDRGVEKKSEL